MDPEGRSPAAGKGYDRNREILLESMKNEGVGWEGIEGWMEGGVEREGIYGEWELKEDGAKGKCVVDGGRVLVSGRVVHGER